MVIQNHLWRLQEQLELLEIAKANELQQIAHMKAGLIKVNNISTFWGLVLKLQLLLFCLVDNEFQFLADLD